MDIAERATKERYRIVRKRLREIYGQAGKEVKRKFDEYTARFLKEDARRKAMVEAGEMTEAAYKKWRKGQVFIGKQWKSKIQDISDTMVHANEEAARLVNGERLNVFRDAMNYSLYKLERTLGIRTTFSLYSRQAVSDLIKDNPQLLPEWKINEKKDYIWNYNRVRNSITQGIIQGESIPDISKRLAEGLQTGNDEKMNLFARTGMTGAHNAGRQHMAEEAEAEGIETYKQWIASLDNRTRDTHQRLDGQIVKASEPFVIDDMEIMFPGDPSAPPELVYNCRCSMKEVYSKVPQKRERRAYREVIDDKGKVHRESYITTVTNFQEWKEAGGLSYENWQRKRR